MLKVFMVNPDVRFENVFFSYGTRSVLEHVSVDINKGDSICIIGPNGGGKSTFLKLIIGLLKPTRGSVYLLGKQPHEVAHRIGYIPQYINFDPLFPITVLETVLMGRLGNITGGPYRKKDKQAAYEALEELDLTSLAHQPFTALSGGQRQRVLIARALSCQPELLLLDEPTANIDALIEVKLFEILKQLNKRMTIVMVSHDIGVVSTMFNRVFCVNKVIREHMTEDITGKNISDVYGGGIRVVRHTPTCIPEGPKHD